jgi:hypothetical protein
LVLKLTGIVEDRRIGLSFRPSPPADFSTGFSAFGGLLCFWIEAAERERRGRQFLARKSETRLSLPHEQSCPSAWPRPQAPVPAPLNAREKEGEKYFPL